MPDKTVVSLVSSTKNRNDSSGTESRVRNGKAETLSLSPLPTTFVFDSTDRRALFGGDLKNYDQLRHVNVMLNYLPFMQD